MYLSYSCSYYPNFLFVFGYLLVLLYSVAAPRLERGCSLLPSLLSHYVLYAAN